MFEKCREHKSSLTPEPGIGHGSRHPGPSHDTASYLTDQYQQTSDQYQYQLYTVSRRSVHATCTTSRKCLSVSRSPKNSAAHTRAVQDQMPGSRGFLCQPTIMDNKSHGWRELTACRRHGPAREILTVQMYGPRTAGSAAGRAPVRSDGRHTPSTPNLGARPA